MATLWSGCEGQWVVFESGSELPDLSLGCNVNSHLMSVLFGRPFGIFASTCGMGEGGMWEYTWPIPISPTGVKLVHLDAENLELEKDWVGCTSSTLRLLFWIWVWVWICVWAWRLARVLPRVPV